MSLSGSVEAAEVLPSAGESILQDIVARPLPLSSLNVTSGRYPVRELLLSSNERLALVGLPDDERWIRQQSPLPEADIVFLQEIGEEPVQVLFFADGDRAIVLARGDVYAAQIPERRVRGVGNIGILEYCRMEKDLEHFNCSLDMGFGATANIDADGDNAGSTFVPQWRRERP